MTANTRYGTQKKHNNMEPEELLNRITKSQLSDARGKLQAHSTRDYPNFLKQLSHIKETFAR